jgi:hypothetical protein
MLRVWLNCIPFQPRESGVNMAAPPDVYAEDEQLAVVGFLRYEQVKGQKSAQYRQHCFP